VELVALVPLVVGVGIGVVGLLGLLERLPRNRFGGVRTPATLRSDETFRVANKIGGLPISVAGLVGIVSGVLGLVTGLIVVTIVGFVGMAAIAVAGGVLAHRAAEAMPEPAPELPEGCKGCACGGCDLAAAVKGSVGADVAGVRGE
jgi:hypothetical protein